MDGRLRRPVIWEGARALAALARRGYALGWCGDCAMFQAVGRPPAGRRQAAKVLAPRPVVRAHRARWDEADTSAPQAGGAKPPALWLLLFALCSLLFALGFSLFLGSERSPPAAAGPQPLEPKT